MINPPVPPQDMFFQKARPSAPLIRCQLRLGSYSLPSLRSVKNICQGLKGQG